MAKAINTKFDQIVEEDVLLEQIDGKEPAVATTLKNAENVFKSYLYLKKMYSGSLSSEKILAMGSLEVTEYEAVTIPEEANSIIIHNTSSSIVTEIEVNGGKFILGTGKDIKLPIVSANPTMVPPILADALRLKGTLSYIILIKEM